ncbi:hypothetical protein BDP27DRAFT_1438273 [Rhodocollybia butyracea]|uniref:Uncharacterized protein n=1 Tax=Rhodocollybia butyracea TaxID=206335 RepID=A0A9P5P3U1_9AGAR|nr:hypothetical protein BDP27DRAFT_1438273 [Rhodocollybia butyracea]
MAGLLIAAQVVDKFVHTYAAQFTDAKHADIRELKCKGKASQLQHEAEAMPDIILQQSFGADTHNHDMPMGCDYGHSRGAEPADDNGDLDWEIEIDEEMLKKDMRENAGFGTRKYQDYRTRRDRTEAAWKHWEGQAAVQSPTYLVLLVCTFVTLTLLKRPKNLGKTWAARS